MQNITKAIQKVKNVCTYSPRTCYVAADHWFLVFSVMLKSCLMQLSRGKCRDSCDHGCADWESRRLWGVKCYSFSAGRWDLRLSCRRGKLSRWIVVLHDNAGPHTARQTQALLREQFHWDIFEHPPYCQDLTPSDFFLFPKMKELLAGKLFANDDLKDASWITRRPHGMKSEYTNCSQGTTSALSLRRLCGKVDEGMCQNWYTQFMYYE